MKRLLYLCLVTGLFLGACSNQAKHEDSHSTEELDHHDHGDEEIKQELVAYSDEFELFAEADPFVVGENASILAHFTYLSDFKPLEGGKVTAILSVAGKVVSQKSEQPLRSGIYQFALKPEVSGKGTLLFEIETANQQKLIQLDVTVFADDHEALHAIADAENEHGTAIAFTKEQSWKIDFATALPVLKPFGPVLKTTALVQPAPAKSQVLTAKASGIIHYILPNLVEGMLVGAGQKLFQVSGSGIGDNNTSLVYASASSNYEKEKADYERMQKLAEKQIVSQREALEAKNSFSKAKAEYENLQQNFKPEGQIVSTGSAGSIGRILVQNGQFVEAGTPIISINQLGRVQLKADVQQKYTANLNQLISVTVKPAAKNEWVSLESLNGKLLSVGSQVSSENFLIPVYFEVDNPGDFVPGSFVGLNLKTNSEKEQLVVPNSALIEQQGNFFVFVQADPEHFEKRQVTIGSSDGMETIIVRGLSEKERLVTRGAVLVKLAAVSGSLDPHAGHVH